LRLRLAPHDFRLSHPAIQGIIALGHSLRELVQRHFRSIFFHALRSPWRAACL
jgi:hypothetical protein